MGSNLCRKIQLLGISHPVVGITISGIGGTTGDEAHPQDPSCERKGSIWPCFVFCKS